MNFNEAYKALTGNQISRKNTAWGEGWRLNNEGHKLTVENRKTGESHVGYRKTNKDMTWSKRIDWQ